MKLFSQKIYYLPVIFICLFPCSISAYEMDDCISCHSDNPGSGAPQISIREYRASIHGTMMSCQECHTDIEEGHEKNGVTGKVDCSNCHSQKNLHGAASGPENQPACYACHTKHNILPAYVEDSSINEKQFGKLCIECHRLQFGETGYLKWFTSLRVKSHKKEDFSRNYDATDCAGCHKIEIHKKIEEVSEGKCVRCHMKGNKNALMGRFHAAENSGPFITGLSIVTQILIMAVLLIAVGFIINPPGRSGKGRK